MGKTEKIILAALIFVFFVLNLVFFKVDEKEVAIVTQFGKPIKTITEPGLNTKLPYPIQQVIRFDTRLLVFDPPPAEMLTSDKKNILVDSFMCWKVIDPEKFLVTVNDKKGAESRLSDILSSELGAALGRHPLSSLISTNNGEIIIGEIMKEIAELSSRETVREYGVEIVDVAIKQLNLPDQNKASVFKRMRAERARIAQKYRSEGEEESMKIKAGADMERSRILSEAKMKAQKIKGEADAEAIKIYAEAFDKNPDFYRFSRTLESYKKFLNDKTTIVLPGDSDLLKYLNTTKP